ncbi:hypothetical protein CDIK_1179 [Cucumispora dikerogammari]|nr:hypothetical protein CDIK_1179 [Cucumispora dikerogammari]
MQDSNENISIINGIVYEHLINNNYVETAKVFLKEAEDCIVTDIDSKKLINTLPALLNIYSVRNEKQENLDLVNKIEMILMAHENTKKRIKKLSSAELEAGDKAIANRVSKKVKDFSSFKDKETSNKTENIYQQPCHIEEKEASYDEYITEQRHSPGQNGISGSYIENYPLNQGPFTNSRDNIFGNYTDIYPLKTESFTKTKDNAQSISGFQGSSIDHETPVENTSSAFIKSERVKSSEINNNSPYANLVKSEQAIRLIQEYTFTQSRITALNANQTSEVFVVGQETGEIMAIFLKDMSPIDLSQLRQLSGAVIDILIESFASKIHIAVLTSEFEIVVFEINLETAAICIVCDLTLNSRIVSFAIKNKALYIAYEDRELQKVDFNGDLIKSTHVNNMIKTVIHHKNDLLVISDSVQAILYDFEKEFVVSEITTRPVDLLRKDGDFYIVCIDDLATIYNSKLEFQTKIHVGIEYTTVTTTGKEDVFVAFNREVYWHGASMKCLNTNLDVICSLMCFKVEDQTCLISGSFSGEVNVYFATYE